jgi:hypothetical protein
MRRAVCGHFFLLTAHGVRVPLRVPVGRLLSVRMPHVVDPSGTRFQSPPEPVIIEGLKCTSLRRCWLNAGTATSYSIFSSGSTIHSLTLPGSHCTTLLVTKPSWSFRSLGWSHRLLTGEQCKSAPRCTSAVTWRRVHCHHMAQSPVPSRAAA